MSGPKMPNTKAEPPCLLDSQIEIFRWAIRLALNLLPPDAGFVFRGLR